MKLSRKLVLAFSGVLIVFSLLLILFENIFLDIFFIHQKRETLINTALDVQEIYIELIDQFEVDEEEKVVSIGLRKVDTNLLNLINDALAKISAETRESLMVSAIESGE